MYKTKSDLNLFSSSTIHRELGPYKMKKTSFEMVKSITLNKHFFVDAMFNISVFA